MQMIIQNHASQDSRNSPSHASAPSLVRLPPLHPQNLKYLLLVPALVDANARQRPLIQLHLLLAREKPHTTIKEVISREVEQAGAYFSLWDCNRRS